jgi:hypothetical protein
VVDTTDSTSAGLPCNEAGEFLPAAVLPTPLPGHDPEDWFEFRNRTEFKFAEFCFANAQLSRGKTDTLLNIWNASSFYNGGHAPFADTDDMHNCIDSIPLSVAPWKTQTVTYTGPRPMQDVPEWMTIEYKLHYRNSRHIALSQLSNPDFNGHIDYAPYKEFDSLGCRRWTNFMSASWAWKEAVSTLFRI